MRLYCTAHPYDLSLYKQSVVLDRVTEPSSFPVGHQPLPVYKLLLHRIQYSGPDLCSARKYPSISLKPRLSSWIICRSTQRPYFQSHLSKPDPGTTSSVHKEECCIEVYSWRY